MMKSHHLYIFVEIIKTLKYRLNQLIIQMNGRIFPKNIMGYFRKNKLSFDKIQI